MYFYKIQNEIAFSLCDYPELQKVTEDHAKAICNKIFYLTKMEVGRSRRSFCISDESLLYLEKEGLDLLRAKHREDKSIPDWILSKIKSRKVISINTSYSTWEQVFSQSYPSAWRINLVGLGDVGGMLLTGLRLLSENHVSTIGIYSRSQETVKRWEYECNQIMAAFEADSYPIVKGISKHQIFDCDMFVFCASQQVPPVGSNVKDVRMVQLESNSRIISEYAKLAREKNFKGIFAVVSDPVDLLCKVAFIDSNKNNNGIIDYKGLVPEQIRGYGLGVMNARANYYASLSPETNHYKNEGRAFGPHGNGLVIANSINNYNDTLSLQLTQQAITANLEIRKAGYKPFIAPALSSGALSILSTIKGEWHYSSTFMGGVYMGAKNRLSPSGTEIERLVLPDSLYKRLVKSYEGLAKII